MGAVTELPLLTEDQRAAYREKGFVVVEDIFSADEVARMLEVLDELVEASRAVETHDSVYDLEPDHSRDDPRLGRIAFLDDFDHLREAVWEPQPFVPLQDRSIFEVLDDQDVLLHHPYDSFEPVVRLVEEAADDPDVIAIKQVLYRTASNSRIIAALIRAAEKGKNVVVLVELIIRRDDDGGGGD